MLATLPGVHVTVHLKYHMKYTAIVIYQVWTTGSDVICKQTWRRGQ